MSHRVAYDRRDRRKAVRRGETTTTTIVRIFGGDLSGEWISEQDCDHAISRLSQDTNVRSFGSNIESKREGTPSSVASRGLSCMRRSIHATIQSEIRSNTCNKTRRYPQSIDRNALRGTKRRIK